VQQLKIIFIKTKLSKMEKELVFANNGVLSIMDLTVMGGSQKRGDSSTIGQYATGLKNAIAILVRNEVAFHIKSGESNFVFGKEVLRCTKTGKVNCVVKISELVGESTTEHITAISVDLGFDWKFEYAIRELLSNMKDEGGAMNPLDEESYDTRIVLDACHESVVKVLNNWGSFFLGDDEVPLLEAYGVKIYSNPDSLNLTIYKNTMQVFSHESRLGLFRYDILSADIDEMRTLRNDVNSYWDIANALKSINDKSLILFILNNITDEYVENSSWSSSSFSSTWVEVVNDLYASGDLPECTRDLMSAFKDDSRFEIGVKSISIGNSWYDPKVEVTIVDIPEPQTEVEVKEISFEDKIKNICLSKGLVVNYPILESIIDYSLQVVADEKMKILCVDSSFTEDNVWEILKEQCRLASNDKNYIYKLYLEK